MRIIAVFEVVKVVWGKAKAAKKKHPGHHAKHVERLKKERDCFHGMADSLKKEKE